MADQVDIMELANIIYGEAANQKPEVMKMVGSTVINRLNAGKVEEFGASIPEVIYKGYFAASNPNTPYQQARTGQFPDEKSQHAYKQAMQIASGLLKGTIAPDQGQFYFTKKEIANLKKKPKAFNFKAVKSFGSVGDYEVFGYK